MNIVVIGAGGIGQSIAERLTDEGHSVTLIDSNEEHLSYASNNLDAMTILGNGADYNVLTAAGVGKADLLIAVTDDDAVNMLCCLTSKKLGVRNAVARVRTMEYFRQMVFLKDELGLSFVFNPEQYTAAEISRVLRFPSAAKVESFAKDRAELVEFTVADDTRLDGLRLKKLRERYGAGVLVCAVVRGGEIHIPNGDFELLAGDTVYMVGAPMEMSAFFKAAGIYKKGVRSVILLGGGRLSLYLGHELLEAGIRVKILEKNPDHCVQVKSILPKAEVIHGDGTNPSLLEEEGIRDSDAFVALTGSDQNNIITSMFAAKSGCGKVITKINNDYFRTMIGPSVLDTFVSPKAIASDHIIQYVRAVQNSIASDRIESLHEIAGGKAETLEFSISGSGKYIGIPIKSLHMRDGTLLAAIIRGSVCVVPAGSDTIQAGDSVIAITTRFGTQCFEDLFEDDGI